MSTLRPGVEPVLPALPLDRDWTRPQSDDPRTLHEMLELAINRYGELNAFSYVPDVDLPRMELSYSEFGSLVDACARALRDHGVDAGTRVAMIMNNRVEWGAIAYASNALGAVYTSMYVDQHVDEWAYIIDDSTPEIIVCGDTSLLDRLVEKMPTDADRWSCSTVILLGEELANDIPPEGIVLESWQEFIISGRSAEELKDVPRDYTALAALIYTSGSTGQPKGVMLSNWNMLHNILALQGRVPVVPGDRSAALLPWMHSFGNTVDVHAMLHNGMQICLIFDRKNVVAEMQEIRPITMTAVPRVWNAIYSRVMEGMNSSFIKRKLGHMALREAGKRIGAAGVDAVAVKPTNTLDKILDKIVLGKIRARFGGELVVCLSGAAALSPEVALFMQKIGITIFEGYGLTETSPVATSNGWEVGHLCKLGTVGRALPGVRIEIDKDAWDNPDSDDGEIIIHGPNVMIGYWEKPEQTTAVLRTDGGLRTGDLGRLEDGFLRITGRVKSQFKLQNGKYVSPAPLEENLKLSPLVEQCVLDGRGRENTFLIVYPNEGALRAGLSKDGVDTMGTLNELARCSDVKNWLLAELLKTGMKDPVWKSYERPDAIIIDSIEWTTKNRMLTPSLKTRLRGLMERHSNDIDTL